MNSNEPVITLYKNSKHRKQSADDKSRNSRGSRIEIQKSSSRTVTFRKKIQIDPQDNSRERIELEMLLNNIQIEESSSYEVHKTSWRQYELYTDILDQILCHIDSIKLEIKSSNRLALLLNHFVRSDEYIPSDVATNLENLCKKPNLEIIDELKSKILNILENTMGIKKMKYEMESDKRNYETAIKNFKIILETMNLRTKDMNKLGKQFEDVLYDYQQSRALLETELPPVVLELRKMLIECINIIGSDFQIWSQGCQELVDFFRTLDEMTGDLNIEYSFVKTYSDQSNEQ